MPNKNEAPSLPALVVDGSGSRFFSGILGIEGQWKACKEAEAPALESLFKTVQEVLDAAEAELSDIESYIYCEGPGSVLGLRLCAMAIETWRRLFGGQPQLFAYNSLALVAADLAAEQELREEALLISDWKKDRWNSLKIERNGTESVCSISSEELAEWRGPLYYLPARKGWQQAPAGAIELSYHPESLAPLLRRPGLLTETKEVILFQSGLNTFQKWKAERHRAVSP